MTIQELIQAGKNQVRSNPDLMSAYINLFKEKFGRKPDCAGCTFNNDWERLINSSNSQTIQIMSDKTFKLRDNSKIYSYDVNDSKAERPIRKRSYGNIMTEEFAELYLTHGSEEEIKARKREFAVLPKKFIDSEEVDLSKLTVAKLKAVATEKEFPKEEWENLKKDELVAYLETKSIEAEEETE